MSKQTQAPQAARQSGRRPSWLAIPLPKPVALVLRLGLAVVALWAAIPKLTDLAGAQRAVHAYRIFPEAIGNLIGIGLPLLELAVGLCLLAGLLTRYAAALFGLLMLAFVVGITSAWARGLNIDCGCFGGGGDLPAGQGARYGWEIARDIGLAGLALYLVLWPASTASLDKVLRLDPAPKGAL